MILKIATPCSDESFTPRQKDDTIITQVKFFYIIINVNMLLYDLGMYQYTLIIKVMVYTLEAYCALQRNVMSFLQTLTWAGRQTD